MIARYYFPFLNIDEMDEEQLAALAADVKFMQNRERDTMASAIARAFNGE